MDPTALHKDCALPRKGKMIVVSLMRNVEGLLCACIIVLMMLMVSLMLINITGVCKKLLSIDNDELVLPQWNGVR